MLVETMRWNSVTSRVKLNTPWPENNHLKSFNNIILYNPNKSFNNNNNNNNNNDDDDDDDDDERQQLRPR